MQQQTLFAYFGSTYTLLPSG